MSPRIVQFPHPGGEHVPAGEWMPWNTGLHRRKFIVSAGHALDGDGHRQETELVFWGEWEAPSAVIRRWPRSGDLPTVLHRPFVAEPPPGHRQNTDPWVFGDAFLYSNCKQLNPRPNRSASALQQLGRGSIILFGSVLAQRFVLDTVFVVGDVVGQYTPASGGVEFDPIFQLCTIESLTTDDTATAPLTLYRGATPATPAAGMFSFVPCMRANDPRQRFERPPTPLPGVTNPKSRQSPSGAKVSWPLDEVEHAWSSVVDQVLDAGLLLGCDFAAPERR